MYKINLMNTQWCSNCIRLDVVFFLDAGIFLVTVAMCAFRGKLMNMKFSRTNTI